MLLNFLFKTRICSVFVLKRKKKEQNYFLHLKISNFNILLQQPYIHRLYINRIDSASATFQAQHILNIKKLEYLNFFYNFVFYVTFLWPVSIAHLNSQQFGLKMSCLDDSETLIFWYFQCGRNGSDVVESNKIRQIIKMMRTIKISVPFL